MDYSFIDLSVFMAAPAGDSGLGGLGGFPLRAWLGQLLR